MKKSLLLVLVFFSAVMVPIFAQPSTPDLHYSNHRWRPGYDTRKIGNTIIFQGNNKKRNYFEGWYFKMVSADGSAIMSVIPGIALSKDGKEQHAFVQVIDGKTAQTRYYSYPVEEFWFARDGFAVKVGNNYFSKDRISLDLKDDSTSLSGSVSMSNRVEYTTNDWINPGIMGWYRFVPFMECYHGVVSLTHNLSGTLTTDATTFDFTGGKGYIEKDWGSGMPSAWIWMQSNHFSNPTSSLMLSVATIPWLGSSFNGFLGFFYHEGTTYHFATYRRSKLKLEVIDDSRVQLKIVSRDHTLLIEAKSNNAGMLHAPVEGVMDRRIPESIDAEVKVTLLNRKGDVVVSDSSSVTGLEMVGDYRRLQHP